MRYKDLENTFTASERNTASARQNLVQVQQRTTEWERRAVEAEGQLESLQTKLDQAEQAHAQLDADYSLVKLQLEEREAEDRAAKVCCILFSHFLREGKTLNQNLGLHRIMKPDFGKL
jgi:lipopolysaccharide biosynthesis regulator YciM